MASTVHRATLVFGVILGAAAMAAPSIAEAQARSRSGGGGGAPSRAPAGPSRSAPAPAARPAQAAPRTGPSAAPGSSASRQAVAPSRAGTAVSRGPSGQPATGNAVTRVPGSGGPVYIGHPIYPGYGYGYGYPYYPYYGYGYPYYGFAFGYPYYGYPYYGYGGFAYYGPGVSVGVHVGGGEALHAEEDYVPPARMGSIRLRINPSHGQVYIDGALAGRVDEFNGLSSHLELTAGPHDLEVRAPGYKTYQTQIVVEADRTTTTRASLSKK